MFDNLKWFDENGRRINLTKEEYEVGYEHLQGRLLFPENGSETFKSKAFYLMEEVKEYISPELRMDNYTLFPPFPVSFKSSEQVTEMEFDGIETFIPTSDPARFYSKWLIAPGIDKKFPKGSFVFVEGVLDSLGVDIDISYPLPEEQFNSRWVVVRETRKNGILVLLGPDASNSVLYDVNQGTLIGSKPTIKGFNGISLQKLDLYNSGDYSQSDLFFTGGLTRIKLNRPLQIKGSKSNEGTLIASGNPESVPGRFHRWRFGNILVPFTAIRIRFEIFIDDLNRFHNFEQDNLNNSVNETFWQLIQTNRESIKSILGPGADFFSDSAVGDAGFSLRFEKDLENSIDIFIEYKDPNGNWINHFSGPAVTSSDSVDWLLPISSAIIEEEIQIPYSVPEGNYEYEEIHQITNSVPYKEIEIGTLTGDLILKIQGIEFTIPYQGTIPLTLSGGSSIYTEIFKSFGIEITQGLSTSGLVFSCYLYDQSPLDIQLLCPGGEIYSWVSRESEGNWNLRIASPEYFDQSLVINMTDLEFYTGAEVIHQDQFTFNTKPHRILWIDSDSIVFEYFPVISTYSFEGILGFPGIYPLVQEKHYVSPRSGWSGDIQSELIFKWEEDILEGDEIFYFDFSGDQLPTSGEYVYSGPKPLIGPNGTELVFLNKLPNQNKKLNKLPKYQQTVFEELSFPLEFRDSLSDPLLNQQPIQVYVGFQSPEEGVVKRTLLCEHKRNKVLEIQPQGGENYLSFSGNKIQWINPYSDFISEGFVEGMKILITGIDSSPSSLIKGQKEYLNNNQQRRITKVTKNSITIEGLVFEDFSTWEPISNGVKNEIKISLTGESTGALVNSKYFLISSKIGDYYIWFNSSGTGIDPLVSGRTGIAIPVLNADSNTGIISSMNTVFSTYTGDWNITFVPGSGFLVLQDVESGEVLGPEIGDLGGYLNLQEILIGKGDDFSKWDTFIKIQNDSLARIELLGQTEIEDIRHRDILQNFGVVLDRDDYKIIKETNLYDDGLDWIFFNQKKKEMVFNWQEIWNYVGSYKAIIESIRFFGWNSLKLSEYYQNINSGSEFYKKFHKVKINDIFNNQIAGWSEGDYISKNLPNKTYKKTNLFDLSYDITDFYGNDMDLNLTTEEIFQKLFLLRRWLRKWVMPVPSRVKSITGSASTTTQTMVNHTTHFCRNLVSNSDINPVHFKIISYAAGTGEVYDVHLEFFTTNDSIPEYFDVNIKTFGFDPNGSTSYPAIQYIKETKIDFNNLNFSVDKNIDPHILIEITTHDGYGGVYSIKQSYTIDPLQL